MGKGNPRSASKKTTIGPSKKKAAKEAQRRRERQKNLMVIGAVIIAIVAISLFALMQKGGSGDNDPGLDDGPDDNDTGDDYVYGPYGRIITGHPTVMDIGSTSCVPCQQLQPVLTSLGEKFDGTINFEFYDCWNTAEGAEKATAYQCSVIPTLIFLDGSGNEVARLMGYNSQSAIEAQMSELGWI